MSSEKINDGCAVVSRQYHTDALVQLQLTDKSQISTIDLPVLETTNQQKVFNLISKT